MKTSDKPIPCKSLPLYVCLSVCVCVCLSGLGLYRVGESSSRVVVSKLLLFIKVNANGFCWRLLCLIVLIWLVLIFSAAPRMCAMFIDFHACYLWGHLSKSLEKVGNQNKVPVKKFGKMGSLKDSGSCELISPYQPSHALSSSNNLNCASCQSHNQLARLLPLLSCRLECHATLCQRCSIHQYIQVPLKDHFINFISLVS